MKLERKMKDMVELIAQTICDKSDQVEVKEIPGTSSSIIEVSVAKEDLGKMIGRQGKTAQSIRNIIYAASFKYNKRYTLEIMAHGE